MCVRSIITYYYVFGVDKLHFLIGACFNVKEYTDIVIHGHFPD